MLMIFSPPIPKDLRPRLEAARLDLLALFRALDQIDLSPAEIPQRLLRELFDLDADLAEALWALDQAPQSLNLKAMCRDTLASLKKLQRRREQFLKKLAPRAQRPLNDHLIIIKATLTSDDAYLGIPGREPEGTHPQ